MEAFADPDKILFERAQRGDRAAYTEIIGRYQLPLYHFAFRLLNDAALAQDATQEALARGWLRRASFKFRGQAKFSTWLFQLARNAAIDLLRKRREYPLEAVTTEPSSSAPDAAEALHHRELAARIAAALSDLPEPQRVAVTLAEYHSLPVREIAAVLHCTARAAESHLYRAKQSLRIALADCWKDVRNS